MLHPKTNREQNWPISKVSWINSIFNRQWPNGSTEESVYATETWKRHVSAAFSCVSANVNPKLRLRKHLFPLAETWRKHAQKVVRFRCIRSNGNARKRHETGNGNTGYPSCFRNGLTCFCHVSVYGFLQFRPVTPTRPLTLDRQLLTSLWW